MQTKRNVDVVQYRKHKKRKQEPWLPGVVGLPQMRYEKQRLMIQMLLSMKNTLLRET